jgi:low temperature requirement protein LtrA
VIVAASLGLVVAAALWWAYFDVVALVAERRFKAAPRDEQNRIARDSYSYLHLPMIAGIVLVALAIKKTLGDVGEPLKTVPAVALCGGVAVYLAAHIGFRLRNVGSLNRQRLAATVAALALIPVAKEVDAVLALGLVGTLLTALIAFEAIYFGEARARVRAGEGN